MICKTCEQSLLPIHAKTHASTHKDISTNDLNILETSIEKCPVPLASGVDHPLFAKYFKTRKIHQKIPFLSVKNGFECIECGVCYASKSSTRSHYATLHPGNAKVAFEKRFKPVRVQGLFEYYDECMAYFRIEGRVL